MAEGVIGHRIRFFFHKRLYTLRRGRCGFA